MFEVYSQNYLLRCTARITRFAKSTCEEYLSNGLRPTDQALHHEQQWVLQ